MKKKSALIFVVVLLGLFSLGTGIVWGEANSLTRVTVVCEGKTGLLLTVDDGFSILKKCPKGTRKVILGEEKVSEVSNESEVVFISNFNFLKKNGEIWNYSPGDQGIFEWSYKGKLPGDLKTDDIYQWDENSFLTKEGKFYVNQFGSWVLAEEIPDSAFGE